MTYNTHFQEQLRVERYSNCNMCVNPTTNLHHIRCPIYKENEALNSVDVDTPSEECGCGASTICEGHEPAWTKISKEGDDPEDEIEVEEFFFDDVKYYKSFDTDILYMIEEDYETTNDTECEGRLVVELGDNRMVDGWEGVVGTTKFEYNNVVYKKTVGGFLYIGNKRVGRANILCEGCDVCDVCDATDEEIEYMRDEIVLDIDMPIELGDDSWFKWIREHLSRKF